jgi:hypothetical protein
MFQSELMLAKRTLFAITLLPYLIGLPAYAQNVIESPPVGFDILDLEAADGQQAKLSFQAPAFLSAVLHQGIATSLGASSLVDVAVSWTDGRFNGVNGPHYVEILAVNGSTNHAAVGVRREISATLAAAKSLELSQPWPTGISGEVKYRIVRHWTIQELFGATKHTGTANSISGVTVVDSASVWEDDEYNGLSGPHYIEITQVGASTTAPEVGMRREIVDTIKGAHSITVNQAWPDGLDGPISYRVVRHMAVRPDGSGHLKAGNTITADSFQLWDGEAHQSYYYQSSGIGGIGWRRAGDQFTDRSNTPILPGQAVILSRGELSRLTLFLRGVVQTSVTPFAIQPGFNFVGNPNAASMTLESSGLYQGDATKGVAGGSLVTADQVMIWNGQGYDSYYYQTVGLGGRGWRQAGKINEDAGSAIIPAASSIIIRRVGSFGFEWRVPAHPVQ